MLTKTSLHNILKALKVPLQEIERCMKDGEYDVEVPKVFVYTPEEMRGIKRKYKRSKALGVAV